jgi:thioredoxin 1
MPEMDGFEVTRRIRQNPQLPFIPILLITGFDQPSMVKGLDMGADGFIRKPVEVNQLLAQVRSLLRLKRGIDERDKIARRVSITSQEQQALGLRDEDLAPIKELIEQQSSRIVVVSQRTFKKEVLKSETPVLVHFDAPWSRLCRIIKPILIEFQSNWGKPVKLVQINADENLKLAAVYRLKSLPTLILFEDGKVLHQLDGFHGLDEVRIALEVIIESNRGRHSNSA